MHIFPKEKIGVMTISNHGIPISVLIGYLEQYAENIFFIGIQPKTMSGKMTGIVKNSGDKLLEIITSKNLEQIETLQLRAERGLRPTPSNFNIIFFQT